MKNVKLHIGINKSNHCRVFQEPILIGRSLCDAFDGIGKAVVYYELLLQHETINSDKYCSELDRPKTTVEEKRPELANRRGVVVHRVTISPHVSLTTLQQLLKLD